MIKSMTGYGKAVLDITGRKLTIEIKTLNSKQLDLNLKIPGYFRDKDRSSARSPSMSAHDDISVAPRQFKPRDRNVIVGRH